MINVVRTIRDAVMVGAGIFYTLLFLYLVVRIGGEFVKEGVKYILDIPARKKKIKEANTAQAEANKRFTDARAAILNGEGHYGLYSGEYASNLRREMLQ